MRMGILCVTHVVIKCPMQFVKIAFEARVIHLLVKTVLVQSS